MAHVPDPNLNRPPRVFGRVGFFCPYRVLAEGIQLWVTWAELHQVDGIDVPDEIAVGEMFSAPA